MARSKPLLSISVAMKATLRLKRSSFATSRVALRFLASAIAAASCGRSLRLPLSTSTNSATDHPPPAHDPMNAGHLPVQVAARFVETAAGPTGDAVEIDMLDPPAAPALKPRPSLLVPNHQNGVLVDQNIRCPSGEQAAPGPAKNFSRRRFEPPVDCDDQRSSRRRSKRITSSIASRHRAASVMCRKKTRCTLICATASTTSATGIPGPQISDVLST